MKIRNGGLRVATAENKHVLVTNMIEMAFLGGFAAFSLNETIRSTQGRWKLYNCSCFLTLVMLFSPEIKNGTVKNIHLKLIMSICLNYIPG